MDSVVIYLIVLGKEWDDIMYFTDLKQAHEALVIHSVGLEPVSVPFQFYPVMYEYMNDGGKLTPRQKSWQVCQHTLRQTGFPNKDIKQNPHLGFSSIQEKQTYVRY